VYPTHHLIIALILSATALVAEEAGVLLTDAVGAALDCPLDIHSDVAWVGYANPAIRAQIEPALQAELAKWPRGDSIQSS